MNLAITGANSGVGNIFLRHLAGRTDIHVVACVRSARAAATLRAAPGISVREIDYDDRDRLTAALRGAACVVHLAGIMASEIGASVKVTKRAALLHDLGKAMTHEVEGSHASISAQLARRYGESQHVVHAIEAHHYEVEPQTVEAVLLIAADAISASRPGARGESLEHYIKRLASLEELAAQKPGVEKVYALQAGREIRVIVKPGEVDDESAALLSHEIAREIEDQLEYPGQVKVTVIRESRAIDVARNVTNGGPGSVPLREGSGGAQPDEHDAGPVTHPPAAAP